MKISTQPEKIFQIMYELSSNKICYNLAVKKVSELFEDKKLISSENLEEVYNDGVKDTLKGYGTFDGDKYLINV